MSTFYLDCIDSEMSLEAGTLVVRSGDRRQTVPIGLLKRLVIAAKTRLDTMLLLRLAEQGVTVVLFDPRRLERRAQVLGSAHNDVRVRLAQYRASADESRRLALAREWVAAKLRRHSSLLGMVASSRPELRGSAHAAAQRIIALQKSVSVVDNLAAMRGLEGSAAQVFFEVYQRLFAPSLGFTGRKKRPPPDPVNATLSLAYTLLHARAVQAAWTAGLDPSVGFYHEPAWGRESLACDLIEPWRPCIDRSVYGWFRSRYLEADHFKRQAGGCFLDKAGRSKFFAAFERQMAPLERALRLQCRALVRSLTEEGHASSVS
ncbi:MAG: CRISPR-associated endonuclease Cas1 [Methylohalobius sp.]|nr:CRISPR-associated endonuclease Cas1 [Methylohalobius sp.]